MRQTSILVCSACGLQAPPTDPYPFRCPNADGDDLDHVMVRRLRLDAVAWPDGHEQNPFVRYRSLLHPYHVARSFGMSDTDFVSMTENLNAAVAHVDGTGFRETPFARSEALGEAMRLEEPGGVWVKDETGNVSGSHKGRHLMGIMLQVDVAERWGPATEGARDLAIASCGNAALAAAVVARAARRTLRVFVPPDAEEDVLRRLKELHAEVVTCEREPGVTGDPTYHALRRAIAEGALPFTCQGNENGLAIEGGQTLAWEIAGRLPDGLDRVVVQVGGGALASAVAQGFDEAMALGALPRSPVLNTVQTRGAHPLDRAYRLLAARIGVGEPGVGAASIRDAAARIATAGRERITDALRDGAEHRSRYMWPWEEEPRSVARGILDDETYDWRAVVEAMVRTGGYPLVVDEGILEEANALGRSATGIDVDHTGTAGLAGLLALSREGLIGRQERIAVLFTGLRR